MTFIRNLWYVAAWSSELEPMRAIGRTIIGEPLALYRRIDGSVVALEDRCPHRHAPLSLGRVEGDDLRCMYHGLKFGTDGVCKSVPGAETPPPGLAARTYPVVERSSWIWVWPGDPALADPALVPTAFGLDNPLWSMSEGALDYAADYELLNDNLTDLSHLDFVHETTLGASTGAKWALHPPRINAIEGGLLIERWLLDHVLMPGRPERADTFNSYRYLLPGVFLMTTAAYPPGTAAARGHGPPDPGAEPLFERAEQQAVTPIGDRRSRYLYATGPATKFADPRRLEGMMAVVNAAFAEDMRMIEAQQRVWDATPPDRRKAFLPQDKAPALFRRLIARRLAAEQPDATVTTPDILRC